MPSFHIRSSSFSSPYGDLSAGDRFPIHHVANLTSQPFSLSYRPMLTLPTCQFTYVLSIRL